MRRGRALAPGTAGRMLTGDLTPIVTGADTPAGAVEPSALGIALAFFGFTRRPA